MTAPNPPNALRVGADIAERLLDFGAQALGLANQLPRTDIGRHVALQVARAATSAGANYEEARAAESARDFAHKAAVAAKEMREAAYWIRMIARSGLFSGNVAGILHEAGELSAVLGACVRTARKRESQSLR